MLWWSGKLGFPCMTITPWFEIVAKNRSLKAACGLLLALRICESWQKSKQPNKCYIRAGAGVPSCRWRSSAYTPWWVWFPVSSCMARVYLLPSHFPLFVPSFTLQRQRTILWTTVLASPCNTSFALLLFKRPFFSSFAIVAPRRGREIFLIFKRL